MTTPFHLIRLRISNLHRLLLSGLLSVSLLFSTNAYAISIFDKLVAIEKAKDVAQARTIELKTEIPKIDDALLDNARKSDSADRAAIPIQRAFRENLATWEMIARKTKRASSNTPNGRNRSRRMMRVVFSQSIPLQLKRLSVIHKAEHFVRDFHHLMYQRANDTVALAIAAATVELKEKERTALLKGSKHDPKVIQDLDDTAKKLASKTQGLRDDNGDKEFHRKKGTLVRPIRGTSVTYPFGPRHVTENTTVRHTGQTWVVPIGTEVRACAPGKVVFAEAFPGFGNVIIIDHGSGYSSLYAHLGTFLVKVGDRVTRGKTIATTGETGSLDGPKLYFELRDSGTPVDPESWYLFQ